MAVIDMAMLDLAVTENTRIDSGRLDAANTLRRLADSLNEELERSTDRDQRSGIGQFTTPSDVARTIASLVGKLTHTQPAHESS